MTGKVIWITGLSGAGKTTLAEHLNVRLQKNNLRPVLLDGDVLRNIFKAGSSEDQSYSRNSRINLGLKYGLAVQSGTSAIHVALKAAGVKEKDFVITPNYTCISNLSCISQCNTGNCWNRKRYIRIRLWKRKKSHKTLQT